MKTLWKKDSKGKIRIWTVSTNDDVLIQESGLKDGKLVKHQKTCIGKNIGKSNSTTGRMQAMLEMKSLIKQKFDEGYFLTKEEAENEVVILPMLAKSYDDEKHKIDWDNCFIQPKLDGQRCLIIIKNSTIKLLSRDGKLITTMQHIVDDLEYIWKDINQDVIYDGELYLHGLSFQENMKLIKKVSKDTIKVKFHCYDVINNEPFKNRQHYLDDLLSSETVELVETYFINNETDLKSYHSKFLSQGYEGSIIRLGDGKYKINGRSSDLLKHKDFQDIDAEIIDVLPNDANPLHGTPLLQYNLNKLSGQSKFTFKAGCKMSHSDREDLLKNKHLYIGKKANIRFFEWTYDGLPRFPIMIGIYEDR